MDNRSLLDGALTALDKALKAVITTPSAARPIPHAVANQAENAPEVCLSEAERAHAAGLMRVNHAGEVAAQALYHGQSIFAQGSEIKQMLRQAAREEADHLAWCDQRLRELGSRPSLLGPVWYAGGFIIGALAAKFGDSVSLGFISETEKQVEGHIDSHLKQLPSADARSRAILEAMRRDEITHGAAARAAGGAELTPAVIAAMRASSKVMTTASYWL